VLLKGKKFQLHYWHQSCCSSFCTKKDNDCRLHPKKWSAG